MRMDNIIIRVLNRLFDLILLNILWLVCSLPVITIGASTTALYSVMLKIAVNEEGYILREYTKAFRKNFKQSTMIWMILLAIGALFSADMRIVLQMSGMLRMFGMIIMFIAFILYAIEVLFVFPMAALFENVTSNMLKNALLIPISRLPYTLPVLFLTAICAVLTFLNGLTIMAGAAVWSIVGVSALAYANSFFILKVLEPYIMK